MSFHELQCHSIELTPLWGHHRSSVDPPRGADRSSATALPHFIVTHLEDNVLFVGP